MWLLILPGRYMLFQVNRRTEQKIEKEKMEKDEKKWIKQNITNEKKRSVASSFLPGIESKVKTNQNEKEEVRWQRLNHWPFMVRGDSRFGIFGNSGYLSTLRRRQWVSHLGTSSFALVPRSTSDP